LKAAGIASAIYYPRPLHLQSAFAGLHHRIGDYPVSESTAGRVFSLPMHPYLDRDAIDRVVNALA
jgi:dTDP-4-amino-4,6-dideoxygalactose transaminase